MHTVLAIDPGTTHSGVALIDAVTCRPVRVGKIDNAAVLRDLRSGDLAGDLTAIEMIASYGMAVGREVFETCVWVGRFQEAAEQAGVLPVTLVYRRDVKLHLCASSKAKDSNITQALIDRFAYGQPNRGKGTKAAPGWFYGFHKDIWQAYALAVCVADEAMGRAA